MSARRFQRQVEPGRPLSALLKLALQEHEKAVQAATSDTQHTEMLERINQLSMLRENNVTLRADCENYSMRSRELDAKLRTLSAELEPAKEQARIAHAELQARDVQIILLESESKRWQERNAQLLGKYDCIDPAELQALKEEVENTKAQKADFEKRLAEDRKRSVMRRLPRLLPHQLSHPSSLRPERDKVLAEKESWSQPATGDSSDVAKAQLEAEKVELTNSTAHKHRTSAQSAVGRLVGETVETCQGVLVAPRRPLLRAISHRHD
ncbi:hypothetical protein JVU11DRAFT_2182 [Chiua virens]|nr:hypothetical protein JVU11DRAFT_12729 [Chiua virens]KAG9317949.1 hypothetical protein JVU11DRAFT_2182 [Chiua virens]